MLQTSKCFFNILQDYSSRDILNVSIYFQSNQYYYECYNQNSDPSWKPILIFMNKIIKKELEAISHGFELATSL